MKKNVGSTDRLIRLIIALAAIWVAYTGQVQSPWTYVLYAVAAIMVVTALMSSCPIWLMTGINTLKSKKKE